MFVTNSQSTHEPHCPACLPAICLARSRQSPGGPELTGRPPSAVRFDRRGDGGGRVRAGPAAGGCRAKVHVRRRRPHAVARATRCARPHGSERHRARRCAHTTSARRIRRSARARRRCTGRVHCARLSPRGESGCARAAGAACSAIRARSTAGPRPSLCLRWPADYALGSSLACRVRSGRAWPTRPAGGGGVGKRVSGAELPLPADRCARAAI